MLANTIMQVKQFVEKQDTVPVPIKSLELPVSVTHVTFGSCATHAPFFVMLPSVYINHATTARHRRHTIEISLRQAFILATYFVIMIAIVLGMLFCVNEDMLSPATTAAPATVGMPCADSDAAFDNSQTSSMSAISSGMLEDTYLKSTPVHGTGSSFVLEHDDNLRHLTTTGQPSLNATGRLDMDIITDNGSGMSIGSEINCEPEDKHCKPDITGNSFVLEHDDNLRHLTTTDQPSLNATGRLDMDVIADNGSGMGIGSETFCEVQDKYFKPDDTYNSFVLEHDDNLRRCPTTDQPSHNATGRLDMDVIADAGGMGIGTETYCEVQDKCFEPDDTCSSFVLEHGDNLHALLTVRQHRYVSPSTCFTTSLSKLVAFVTLLYPVIPCRATLADPRRVPFRSHRRRRRGWRHRFARVLGRLCQLHLRRLLCR